MLKTSIPKLIQGLASVECAQLAASSASPSMVKTIMISTIAYWDRVAVPRENSARARSWSSTTAMTCPPIMPGTSIVALVEGPRATAQLFYQFDPLFHDNMIFSYHPRSDTQG